MGNRSFTVQLLTEAELPEALRRVGNRPANRLLSENGRYYFPLADGWLSFPESGEGARLAALLEGGSGSPVLSLQEAGKKLLSGCDEATAALLVRRFGIRNEKKRCAIVLEAMQEGGERVFSLLQDLIPAEEGDLLLEMDGQTAVLLKEWGDGGKEEMAEFTRALLETSENEAGLMVRAGIGTVRPLWTQLASSYEEACLAVRIGESFRLPGRVFLYEDLFLERLVNEIPAERRRELRNSMLRSAPETLKSPEMADTIQSFFRNDLSPSATARALFIHRNTLNYRLERIREETGLDIRRFQDAAVLMMLMKL